MFRTRSSLMGAAALMFLAGPAYAGDAPPVPAPPLPPGPASIAAPVVGAPAVVAPRLERRDPASAWTTPPNPEISQVGPEAPRSVQAEPSAPRAWRVRITPLFWIPGTYGDVAVRGQEARLDTSVGDVLDNLDTVIEKTEAALMGGIALEWNDFEVGFEGYHVRVGDSYTYTLRRDRTAVVSGSFTQRIFKLALKYQVYDTTLGGSPVTHDILAGARYYDFSGRLTLPIVGESRGSRDWIDPVVGARIQWKPGRWVIGVEGDVGGFGAGSDLSWSLRASVLYRATSWLGIMAAWQWLDIDYADGTGANRFEWDVLMSGPFIGIQFRI